MWLTKSESIFGGDAVFISTNDPRWCQEGFWWLGDNSVQVCSRWWKKLGQKMPPKTNKLQPPKPMWLTINLEEVK